LHVSLRSVPGVGPIVAATFRLELIRPERFAYAGEVASNLGLAPVVGQSGGIKARAGFSLRARRGIPAFSSLLIKAA
jgi:transposase